MPRWDAVGFFCEDIRREVNNIDTIVGVMSDNLALDGDAGGILPKLAMYVRVHMTLDVDVDILSVSADFFEGTHTQVVASFDRAQIEAEKESVRRNGGRLLGFIIRAILTPFPVTRFGRILLKARVGNEEIVCGGLNITQAAISSGEPSQHVGTAPPSAFGSS